MTRNFLKGKNRNLRFVSGQSKNGRGPHKIPHRVANLWFAQTFTDLFLSLFCFFQTQFNIRVDFPFKTLLDMSSVRNPFTVGSLVNHCPNEHGVSIATCYTAHSYHSCIVCKDFSDCRIQFLVKLNIQNL